MTQPKQSCCSKCLVKERYVDSDGYGSNTVSCRDVNCKCHSVKQSWEERLKVIKVTHFHPKDKMQADLIEQLYPLVLPAVTKFFSAELLRIKTELLEELEKEKQDATYPKGGDFIENMEPKLQSVLNEVFNQALTKAKEIVERNLL